MNSLHYLYHSEIYYIDHFLIINLTLDRVTVVCVLCMLLLLLCGDIETNPGPTRYPCKLCRKPVAKTHRALCCEGCDQWVHILCAGIPKTEYERLCDDSNEDQWFCSICSGDTYQYECESSEHRQARLARKRQRTREETEEEREDRLASRRQRRREETEEEREDRLAREQQRKREETEEEREDRLASRRQRRREETEEEREDRLASRRQRRREETGEEREDRLASRRQRRREETEEKREDRLASRRQLRSNLESSLSKFQDKQEQWQHAKCSVCAEQWPVRKSNTDLDSYICLRCSRDKRSPKMFSAHNDMDPGSVPSCLEGMTQIEEMLIARACPIMTVYRKHGGQRGYQGHVLNLPQNIQQFLKKLPAPIASLPILIIKRVGAENTTAEFRVRRQKVLSALLWLKHNNSFYHDIDIDQVTIASLPQDGIPTELQQIDTDGDEDSVPALPQGPPLDTYTDNGKAEICQTNSFLPMPQGVQREEDSIRQSIAGSNILDWPELGQSGINEFCTEGLATQVFPTLFPFGLDFSYSIHYDHLFCFISPLNCCMCVCKPESCPTSLPEFICMVQSDNSLYIMITYFHLSYHSIGVYRNHVQSHSLSSSTWYSLITHCTLWSLIFFYLITQLVHVCVQGWIACPISPPEFICMVHLITRSLNFKITQAMN